MKNYVNIKTIFSKEDDHAIDTLTAIYADKPALISAINEIASSYLSVESLTGKKVLLKPNWVLHNRKEDDEICLRTHDNFLLAALVRFREKAFKSHYRRCTHSPFNWFCRTLGFILQ